MFNLSENKKQILNKTLAVAWVVLAIAPTFGLVNNASAVQITGSWLVIETTDTQRVSDTVAFSTSSGFELMKFMPYIATLTIAFFILAYIMSFAKIKPSAG